MSDFTHAPIGDLIKKIERIGWTVTERGCWEYKGTPTGKKKDYRCVILNKQRYLVHRVMFTAYKGPIPEGHCIRHRCDNPPCCNPAHLQSGTLADNNQDMVERGRSHRKDVCLRGHDRTDPANIYVQPAVGTRTERRQCRACNEQRARERDRAEFNAKRTAWRLRTGRTRRTYARARSALPLAHPHP